MAGELPRRIRRRFFRNRTAGRLAAHPLNQVAKLFPGHRPLTQQFQRGLALLVKHRTHNRAFQPLGTGSGIQNHFNTAPQFLLHGRGGSRADMAEAIGAGRSYRTPQRFRHPPHGRMSAYANGRPLVTISGMISAFGNTRVSGPGQNLEASVCTRSFSPSGTAVYFSTSHP